MIKKTVATVGLGIAATAGAAFLMQSPASAETTHTPTKTVVNHVQTTVESKARHSTDYRDRTHDHGRAYDRDHHHRRPHYYWSKRYHRVIVVYTYAKH